MNRLKIIWGSLLAILFFAFCLVASFGGWLADHSESDWHPLGLGMLMGGAGLAVGCFIASMYVWTEGFNEH